MGCIASFLDRSPRRSHTTERTTLSATATRSPRRPRTADCTTLTTTTNPHEESKLTYIKRNTVSWKVKSEVGAKLICSICIDPIELDETALTLSCFHVFHQKCALDWLSKKPECPDCCISLIVLDGVNQPDLWRTER